VGIIGAALGGFLFSLLGISAAGLIGFFITATVGAIALLFIVGLIKKSRLILAGKEYKWILYRPA